MTQDEDDPGEAWDVGPFLDAVASNRVAPAGGSVIGFVGAGGTALVEMAAVHTLSHRSDDTALGSARSELEDQRSTLQSLANADARAVDDLFGGATSDEESLFVRATRVPLTMAEACVNVLDAAIEVAESVADSVATDLEVGLDFVIGAALSAVRTVRKNLSAIEDSSEVAELKVQVSDLLDTLAERVGRLESVLSVSFSSTVPDSA